MRVPFHETGVKVVFFSRCFEMHAHVFLPCFILHCLFTPTGQVIVNFDMATEAGRAAALKASQSASGTADGAADVLAELSTVEEAGGADADSGSVKESGWISSVSVVDGQR